MPLNELIFCFHICNLCERYTSKIKSSSCCLSCTLSCLCSLWQVRLLNEKSGNFSGSAGFSTCHANVPQPTSIEASTNMRLFAGPRLIPPAICLLVSFFHINEATQNYLQLLCTSNSHTFLQKSFWSTKHVPPSSA